MLISYISTLLICLLQSQVIFDFKVNDIDGKPINLQQFKGKKILVVNTASKCGYTPQYAELEELSRKYKSKLTVIAFPANNFLHQEPGTDEEIKAFCSKNYGVSFPIASKVSVKGSDIHPLFDWLIKQANPDFTGPVKWNFEKFLIDENGKLIRRFRSSTKPLDPELINSL